MNNLVTTHANKTYDRDYVIDYTSPENDDLYVYALGNGQLEYEQRHVYAGSERLEQITEKGNGGWERTLYVHEDVMGNTRYYTKATGQSFAELEYDAWGQPVSPNKLVNNDHGNYVFATFTGHIYDTTLDIYFAEARFYDAANRQWLAMDPVKDGLNWYQYCGSNPTTNWDPTGLYVESLHQYFEKYLGCNNATGSIGASVAAGTGIWNFSLSISLIADTKGNVGIQVGTGTAISPGAGFSVNGIVSVTNAPDIYALEDMGYSIGGSAYAGIGGGLDILFVPKDDDSAYTGVGLQLGAGAGIEMHANMTYTLDTIIHKNLFNSFVSDR